MRRDARAATLWGIGNTIVILAAAVPVLWIASLSFKDPSTITDATFFPRKWTLQNYRGIFDTALFTRALLNSVGIALIATAWRWSSDRWPPTPWPGCGSPARSCWWARPC
jgi:multiple sugar transport system permease protein